MAPVQGLQKTERLCHPLPLFVAAGTLQNMWHSSCFRMRHLWMTKIWGLCSIQLSHLHSVYRCKCIKTPDRVGCTGIECCRSWRMILAFWNLEKDYVFGKTIGAGWRAQLSAPRAVSSKLVEYTWTRDVLLSLDWVQNSVVESSLARSCQPRS